MPILKSEESDPKCAQDVMNTIAKTNQLQRGCIRLGRNIENHDLASTGVEGDRSATEWRWQSDENRNAYTAIKIPE
jgi:hypothetical protein